MSTDTKAIIRKDVTLQQLKEVLEKKVGEVQLHSTSMKDYFQLIFPSKEHEGNRAMSAFFNDYAKLDHGIDGISLSLDFGDEAVEIMTYLCEQFGGYIDKNDCDDIGFEPINLEMFEKSKDITPMDKFKNRVIHKLGYDNLQIALELFEEFKEIS